MHEPPVSARPSLERLKALDSLPDLSSQLAEAKQLCTHSARADMMAKWLVERLMSSKDARIAPDAWRTLLLTLRLLSPRRTASLLSSFNTISTIKDAVADSQGTLSLLPSLDGLLSFLLEVSAGPNGAAVKAILSVPAALAASFFGVWLQSVCGAFTSDGNQSWSLLSPGIKIWDLRKHSAEENELFAQVCLVPAASLLSRFPAEADQSSKRKRHDYTDVNILSYKQTLESLLARHIFLPARTAFFKAQDLAGSQGRRQLRSEYPTISLESILEPLKSGVAQKDEADGTHLRALSLLLDIGLRCAPAPTPRQRKREAPWIEVLFGALLDCNKHTSGDVRSRTSLIAMLSVVGKHASLLKESLKKIVELHSNLSGTSEVEVDWKLLSRVIGLEADVFVDDAMAETLFSAVTMAGVQLGNDATEKRQAAETGELQRLWKDDIVIPVMRAFARSRKLVKFVDLWSKQLQQDQHNGMWSVWIEIENPFMDLLEEALIEDQVVRLLDRFYEPVRRDQEPRNDAESSSSETEIDASIVILNAILGGVRSGTVNDDLYERYEDMFHKMLELAERTSAGHVRRKWALLMKLFEMWFPAWAAQKDVDVVAEKAVSILSGAVVDYAFAVPSPQVLNESVASALPSEKGDAECFVASLCHHFCGYQQHEILQAGCAETVNRLVRHLRIPHIGPLLRYPSLLRIIDQPVRNSLLEDCIAVAASKEHDEQTSASASQALKTTVAIAVSHAQAAVFDDITGVAVNFLEYKDDKTGELPIAEQLIVLDLLLEIPASSLTRVQREKIIDTVCGPYLTNASPLPETELQKCLAFLVEMMGMSNATSALMTDPASLWCLAVGFDPSKESEFNREFDGYRTVLSTRTTILLEELSKRTMSHLLATQDQDRSRLMLTRLSVQVEKFIKYLHSNYHIHIGALALTRSVISRTELLAKHEMKSWLLHRDPSTMGKFMETLFEKATDLGSDVFSDDQAGSKSEEVASLHAMLETLAAIPHSLTSELGVSIGENIGKLMDFVASTLDRYDFQTKDRSDCEQTEDLDTMSSALVRCYEVGSKFAPPEAASHHAELAIRLLQLQLRPAEHEAVIRAFGQLVNSLPGAARLYFIKKLLVDAESPSAASLPIIQVCISKLDKDDLEKVAGFAPSMPLHALLKMATHNQDLVTSRWAIGRIARVLQEKSFMVNQYAIEEILTTLPKLVQDSAAPSILYIDVCQIVSTMLLQHRSRLQGRFHIVIRLFQKLISQLFAKPKTPTSDETQHAELSAKHARAMARLLTLFCQPPQPRRPPKTSSNLVDESRKEQAHVGQYVQYILHHYCTQILRGTLGDGMREALTPGWWGRD